MDNRMTAEEATLIAMEITRVALTDRSTWEAIGTHLDLSDSVLENLQAWLENHMN